MLFSILPVESSNCQDHFGGLMKGDIHSPRPVNHSMVRLMKGGESLSVLRLFEGKHTIKVRVCCPTDNTEFARIQQHVVRTS